MLIEFIFRTENIKRERRSVHKKCQEVSTNDVNARNSSASIDNNLLRSFSDNGSLGKEYRSRELGSAMTILGRTNVLLQVNPNIAL